MFLFSEEDIREYNIAFREHKYYYVSLCVGKVQRKVIITFLFVIAFHFLHIV